MNADSKLQQFYRQPKIYIKLPSKGKHYSAEEFEPTTTGEIPVYSMTAKDEIKFKTPDALMSGQATVDIIESCAPNVKDAWKIVNYDIDALLMAIRIATYGETMDINYTVPVMNETAVTSFNIPAYLDQISKIDLQESFVTSVGLKIYMAPMRYNKLVKIQQAQFEQEKIYRTVNASTLSQEEKSLQFNKSFNKMNDINFELLVETIVKIETSKGDEVTDATEIQNFINNAESPLVNEIQDKIGEIRKQAQMKPLKIAATEEQIKKGVPVNFDVPITFDMSNFFG